MDIFISYARRDNIAPDLIGAEGFVTSFHNQLLLAFGNRGYEQPSIFRDSEKIANTDQFEPRLRKELDGASILIVILSRNWIHPDREWCHEELNVFANRNLAQLNDRRAVLERIVVVHRHFIEQSKRPDWLGGQVGIKLVEWDKESRKEVFYFDADRGRPCSGKWFDEIGTLAEELEAKLSRVHTLPKTKVDETKNSVEDSPVRPADRYSPTQAVLGRTMPHSRSSPIIFIAEPATDLQQSYDTLRAELGR